MLLLQDPMATWTFLVDPSEQHLQQFVAGARACGVAVDTSKGPYAVCGMNRDTAEKVKQALAKDGSSAQVTIVSQHHGEFVLVPAKGAHVVHNEQACFKLAWDLLDPGCMQLYAQNQTQLLPMFHTNASTCPSDYAQTQFHLFEYFKSLERTLVMLRGIHLKQDWVNLCRSLLDAAFHLAPGPQHNMEAVSDILSKPVIQTLLLPDAHAATCHRLSALLDAERKRSKQLSELKRERDSEQHGSQTDKSSSKKARKV